MPLLTASCAGSSPATDACVWVRPVLVSKADVLTPETEREILALDLAVTANCGSK